MWVWLKYTVHFLKSLNSDKTRKDKISKGKSKTI